MKDKRVEEFTKFSLDLLSKLEKKLGTMDKPKVIVKKNKPTLQISQADTPILDIIQEDDHITVIQYYPIQINYPKNIKAILKYKEDMSHMIPIYWGEQDDWSSLWQK